MCLKHLYNKNCTVLENEYSVYWKITLTFFFLVNIFSTVHKLVFTKVIGKWVELNLGCLETSPG